MLPLHVMLSNLLKANILHSFLIFIDGVKVIFENFYVQKTPLIHLDSALQQHSCAHRVNTGRFRYSLFKALENFTLSWLASCFRSELATPTDCEMWMLAKPDVQAGKSKCVTCWSGPVTYKELMKNEAVQDLWLCLNGWICKSVNLKFNNSDDAQTHHPYYITL